MPKFVLPDPRRHNTLRLLSYDYNSTWQLCAISLVTDLRKPLFADVPMAKSVLKCLLSDQTTEHMRLRAFTLMPDHIHFLAGVRDAEKKLPNLIGVFKSYTTQQYWKRSREIVQSASGHSAFHLRGQINFKRITSIDLSFSKPARDFEARRCRTELAQCKARPLPSKAALANKTLRSRHPQRLRPPGESRLHRNEPCPCWLRHSPTVLSIYRISIVGAALRGRPLLPFFFVSNA